MEASPASELLAQQKYACPACGAEATWNPSKLALVCSSCGTVSPASLNSDKSQIIEHDLVTALRAVPEDARGWQADKVYVKCQSCQAISVFDPAHVAQRCDFCGSAQLLPYEQTKASFRPESLLPFIVPEGKARDNIRAWYASVWFAPNALKSKALTDSVKGIYVPYWTFDAQVHANWVAEAGYFYYTTEEYTDDRGAIRTRQVQQVRWTPASGELDYAFDDDLVCASVGVQPDLLRGIEPFPTTTKLVPYDPGYLAGWVVERYQIDLVAAAQRSRAQMDAKLRGICETKVPGDSHRNLQVQAAYSAQTFKYILAPIWLLTYRYADKPYQVVINGYTGKIAGRYPKSWVKITLAILAAFIILLLIMTMKSH